MEVNGLIRVDLFNGNVTITYVIINNLLDLQCYLVEDYWRFKALFYKDLINYIKVTFSNTTVTLKKVYNELITIY